MGGVSADLCLSGVSADAVQLQRVFAVNGVDKICSKYDTLVCAVGPSVRRGIEWSYSIQRAEVTLSAKTIKSIHCIHFLWFSWCKNIWLCFAFLPFLVNSVAPFLIPNHLSTNKHLPTRRSSTSSTVQLRFWRTALELSKWQRVCRRTHLQDHKFSFWLLPPWPRLR